jgi:hypothetical protein
MPKAPSTVRSTAHVKCIKNLLVQSERAASAVMILTSIPDHQALQWYFPRPQPLDAP